MIGLSICLATEGGMGWYVHNDECLLDDDHVDRISRGERGFLIEEGGVYEAEVLFGFK